MKGQNSLESELLNYVTDMALSAQAGSYHHALATSFIVSKTGVYSLMYDLSSSRIF
jgi:hypothetical protein